MSRVLRTSFILRRSAAVALGGGAAALVLAACGGGSTGSAGAGGGTAAAGQPAVTTTTGSGGSYLTDGSGRALYVFSADKGTTSMCTGGCAQEWMPFTAGAAPKAAGAVVAGKVGTTTRDGGQRQVVYAGHPLYYFAGDQKPGQASGQGLTDFGGTWTLVSPSGTVVAAAAPSGSGSSGGSYGGYGG
ncbi:MAG: hypothetical protein ACJ74O_11860 [Frankiaceae bacterium]